MEDYFGGGERMILRFHVSSFYTPKFSQLQTAVEYMGVGKNSIQILEW